MITNAQKAAKKSPIKVRRAAEKAQKPDDPFISASVFCDDALSKIGLQLRYCFERRQHCAEKEVKSIYNFSAENIKRAASFLIDHGYEGHHEIRQHPKHPEKKDVVYYPRDLALDVVKLIQNDEFQNDEFRRYLRNMKSEDARELRVIQAMSKDYLHYLLYLTPSEYSRFRNLVIHEIFRDETLIPKNEYVLANYILTEFDYKFDYDFDDKLEKHDITANGQEKAKKLNYYFTYEMVLELLKIRCSLWEKILANFAKDKRLIVENLQNA